VLVAAENVCITMTEFLFSWGLCSVGMNLAMFLDIEYRLQEKDTRLMPKQFAYR
jgi:hypothetical protein